MSYKREIERKYILGETSYENAKFRLDILFPEADVNESVSTDTFWDQGGVDFIRLRRNTSELSVKVTDRGTIENRIEENVVVADFDTAKRFADLVFGDPVGELEKNFCVYKLGGGVELALYTVTGDERVFLEVEAPTLQQVIEHSEELHRHFLMRQETRSLYQLIIGEAA